ncbi:hypothetical protein [Streptomyces sp. NBC_00572]|uniref:hypothetical protein n=1 Tax=Streptomyces sp. NBC_00572 TaxID=2903664 RepID=UPI0022550F13|nr:hypothetical protein [Streptomyces sp. NBC_00572]MCX4983084.1 hypothetical protein [Streptomyces sp. NBC_00572]
MTTFHASRGRRRLVTLAALGLAVTGCANQEEPPRKTGAKLEITRDPAFYEGREIVLPLDAYAFTEAQRDDFTDAVHALSGACMKEYGLSWPKVAGQKSPVTGNSRRYGVIDLPRAEKFGYGVPLPDGMTHEEAQKVGRANIDRTRKLPQKTRDVYTGENVKQFGGLPVPQGGCRGRAYKALGAPPQGMDSMALDTLRYESWDQARNSRIVLDAVARWSTCMSKAGYAYKTPEEAVADTAWRREGTAPTAAEITAATTDIRCKRDVMLVEKWHSVEVENQKRLVRAKAKLLGDLERRRDALVARVARAGSGT